MKLTTPVLAAAIALSLLNASSAIAADARLPRATPESQGISSAALLDFIEAADSRIDTFNSVIIVRHGRVVAEGWWAPYTADDAHMLYSLSKSFTSTAVGLAASEGRLSIDDPVLKFFPDEVPAELSENLKQMRMRDLLIMSTGHHADAIANFSTAAPGSLSTEFLALPVAHKPGSHFVYNSPATFMQSAIVQKLTGETVRDYQMPRLFEPLGIAAPFWETTPEGISKGASGLFLRTDDIACFGQMLLQKGMWNGKQLVPAAWVEEATAKQTSNGSNPTSDWDQGYGYQFWRCRPGFYRADGAHGQFCIVMPQHDAVVAITSGVRKMQDVMNLVWEKVMPALGDAPLPANPTAEAALRNRLGSLVVHAPQGRATSPQVATIAGRVYRFPENERGIESVALNVTDGVTSLVFSGTAMGEQTIAIGHDSWTRGRTLFGTDVDPRERVLVDRGIGAIGGWSAPDTFEARLCFFETPYILNLKLQFGGDIVVVDSEYSVYFGNPVLPQLTGRAEPIAR